LTWTLTDGVHDILCSGRPNRPLHWRRALYAPHRYACISHRTRWRRRAYIDTDTGKGERFNVGAFLEETNPYSWAALGIGLCLGLSTLGAGWCVNRGPTFPRFARRVTLGKLIQGYLPHWFFYSWWWCARTENSYQESHQVGPSSAAQRNA